MTGASDGTTHLVFTPGELLERLVPVGPRPWIEGAAGVGYSLRKGDDLPPPMFDEGESPARPGRIYAKAVHHAYRDGDWKTSWDFAGRQSFYGKFDYAK